MRGRIAILSLFICLSTTVFLLSGCATRGSGDIVSRTFYSDDFTAINITGHFFVTYRHANDAKVVVYMQESLLNRLSVTISNGKLSIDTDNIRRIPEIRPRIYVYAPYLSEVFLYGANIGWGWDIVTTQNFTFIAHATVESLHMGALNFVIPLKVESLTTAINAHSIRHNEIVSAGQLTLYGYAVEAVIETIGYVVVDAINLQTDNARILAEEGLVSIAAAETLEVYRVTSLAEVRYTGNPVVTLLDEFQAIQSE